MSNALDAWLGRRSAALDEFETALGVAGGGGPGRRWAVQQINQAYAVLLSSHFQGFCRDLHSESVDHLIDAVRPPSVHVSLRLTYTQGRQLDRGNPAPGAIGADFNRFGLDFWGEVRALDSRGARRQAQLDVLNLWRNAIAHQDFDPARLGGQITVQLRTVRAWRSVCHGLARTFDRVMRERLRRMTGNNPW